MSETLPLLYATAARGIAPLLAPELRRLGATDPRPGSAGVTFRADLATSYRICLWSRLASRVLLPLLQFEAADAEQLYRRLRQFDWQQQMGVNDTFAIDCTALNSPIGHTRYAALKAKDALVDQFREAVGDRPCVDTEMPALRFNLHLRGTSARLALDLGGGSLHRRGYRDQSTVAPLKQNLAAALLLRAHWPDIASRGGGLFDPMCGSGTLLIEAALIAADIAPGLLRPRFGFSAWRQHQPAVWQRLLDEANERREMGLERAATLRIVGQDSDTAAVNAAQANISRAGLDDWLVVRRAPLTQPLPPLPSIGLLITNPPYGTRLGEVTTLRTTYSELGETLRRLPGWQGGIFTGNPELAPYLGLEPGGSVPFHNGPIACQLLQFDAASGLATQSAAALAAAPTAVASATPASLAAPAPTAFTRGSAPIATDLANRLRKNLRHLGRWAARNGIDCWRLYDRDLPEYALAIDIYQGAQRWVHLQAYAPPPSIDPARAAERLQLAFATTAEVLELAPEQIFLKQRQRQRGSTQYQKQNQLGRLHTVYEDGLQLLVNFTDYLDTGLFLDHRPLRRILRQQAAGRRFLNLYSYTGSATLHAAAGGATTTTSVDLSHTYLDWAQRNLEANQLPTGELIAADVLPWLREAARRRYCYDLILLDPPTFSRSKRMQGTLDIQRDQLTLLEATAALLSDTGELYFSNNFLRFQLDEAGLAAAGLVATDISAATIDEDFRRHPNIHRCWRIVRG